MKYSAHGVTHKQSIRRAALKACLSPRSAEGDLLANLSNGEWRKLLPWLDISGLSLYLIDKLIAEGLSDLLPRFVFVKLEHNLMDNMARTRSMLDELAGLSAQFEASRLSFVVLKGVSLWPLSVPKPWLRSQADLDFLIAARDAPRAQEILLGRGFYLHAVSGRSWEFRTGGIHTATLKNMYRVVPFRCVELHLEPAGAAETSLLGRTQRTAYGGSELKVLAPADMLLGQGLHLYKHVCSEFFRSSHVLEFHSHIRALSGEAGFWGQLRDEADRNPDASLKLGVVTLLTMKLCGTTPPAEYQAWTVEQLPAKVRLWIERFGERTAFGDTPGTKLYLLLQAAMGESGVHARRPILRILLPSSLPRTSAPPGEPFGDRVRRYFVLLRFICMRFRFHIIEGFRYLLEATAWSRELSRTNHGEDASVISSVNKEVTIR